jgi:flagellar hook-associated protein 3 FlgL
MKTTSISTLAITNATREMRVNMQVKLAALQKEAGSGRHADVGLALGYLTQRTVSFRQDMDRLKTFKDTNAIATARLEMTQNSLTGLRDAAQSFLQSLNAARSARTADGTAITDAKLKLENFTAVMNTAVSGAHIFSGVNTDVRPMGEYFSDTPSAARIAMEGAFIAEFGVAQGQAGVESITKDQMNTFLDGAFADLFNDTNWPTTWSSASDQNITSRISTNERIETSANANETAFRNLASAFTMIADIGLEELDEGAYLAVVDKAIAVVGKAIFDITEVGARLGTSEERIEAANTKIDIQVTLVNNHISMLEGVDPFEATAKVNELLTQIEASYALTARLQGLSLINFI